MNKHSSIGVLALALLSSNAVGESFHELDDKTKQIVYDVIEVCEKDYTGSEYLVMMACNSYSVGKFIEENINNLDSVEFTNKESETIFYSVTGICESEKEPTDKVWITACASYEIGKFFQENKADLESGRDGRIKQAEEQTKEDIEMILGAGKEYIDI